MMLRKFSHDWASIPKIEQINTSKGRLYETPTGERYPSITTVLSKTKDNSALFAWRRRVGEEQANKISQMATARGSSMHRMCETFLLNEELDDLNNPAGAMMFKTIKPSLERIDNVQALESGLFSHKLSVAGTVDCVAQYNDELTIIDFKTSSKPKKEEYIYDYYLQGCFYFTAFYELTNQLPKQIAILIAVEDGTLQEFVLRGKDIIYWTEQLKKRIEAYYYNEANNTPGY